MNDVKALILCNSPIAIPGIKEFLFYGKVVAVAIPQGNKDLQYLLQPLLQEGNLPLILINKKEYKAQLMSAIESHQPTVGLMMTFPFLINAAMMAAVPKGFINFHFGILPQSRGPQPILRHLVNGDAEAGVTVHIVDEGIDTGPIIVQEKIQIELYDTYGILQGKLAFLAAKLAANLLRILSYGSIIPSLPQDESKAAYYSMPTAAELTIRWKEMEASSIVRIINACNPWNKGAGATINGWTLGCTEATIVGDCEEQQLVGGTILTCDAEHGLIVKTSDHKRLRLNIIYTTEGFFSGGRLADFGIQVGMIFD